MIEEQGACAVIPPKKNRAKKIECNADVGKLRRKVENFFCRTKRYIRVHTRFEQLPETYMGFVTIAAIADYGVH